MAVVDPNYLVGVVTGSMSTPPASRLAIDATFAVGAQLLDSKGVGIAYGQWQNGGRIEMRHVSRDITPEDGEVVVTSDETARIPPAIIIGRVTGEPAVDNASDSQTIQILPAADFDNLSIVAVIVSVGEAQGRCLSQRSARLANLPLYRRPKATLDVLRRSGRGGTAAPGLVAMQIDPEVVANIARRLPNGAVVVAGTNGKTTTARMIADIIEASGLKVLHNRSGSNLARGVAAVFVRAVLADRPTGRADRGHRGGRSRASGNLAARQAAPAGAEQSLSRSARPLWRAGYGESNVESRLCDSPRDHPVDRRC